MSVENQQANPNVAKNKSGCLFAVIILALAIVGTVLIVASKKAPQSRDVEPPLASVAVVTAQPQTLTPVATLYGKVNSPSLATLVASVTANVAQVHVLPGDAVEAGALLVQLDDTEARLQLAQASARARDAAAQYELEKQRQTSDRKQLTRERELTQLAQKSYQRSQSLFSKKLISQSQLDSAQEQYQRQAAALENRELSIRQHKARLEALAAAVQSAAASEQQAELDVSRTTITAPFSGLVVDVPLAVGDRVRNSQTLVTIYDQTQLEIRALVPNRYLSAIRSALKNNSQPVATLQATGFPAIDIPLTRLASAVRQGSGGVDAYFLLPNDSLLELGRNTALLLQLPAVENAVAVPTQAIFGLNAVFIIDQESRLQRIEIDRMGDGLDADGTRSVVIRSDKIQAGSQILATQLPSAITGLKVKPVVAQP